LEKNVNNEEDYVKIFSGKWYKIIIEHYCFQSKPEMFMILLGKIELSMEYDFAWETRNGAREFTYVTKSISPGGIASAFYSDHMGQNIRNISSGLMTETEYDASGKVILTRSGAENCVGPKTVTLSLYNQTGDLTHTIRNPRYDATGKVWKADNEESIVTSSTYDAQGNCLTETDAEGHVTTHVYDKASRLAGISWQDGTGSANTVSYAYDILEPDGTVSTRTTDAKGNSSKVYTNE